MAGGTEDIDDINVLVVEMRSATHSIMSVRASSGTHAIGGRVDAGRCGRVGALSFDAGVLNMIVV